MKHHAFFLALALLSLFGAVHVNANYNLLIPSPPTDLRVLGYTGTNSVTLTWDAPDGTVTGYYIYMNTSTGVQIVKYPVAAPPLEINGLNGTFIYYVSAYNDSGESAKSNALTVTRP